MVEEYKTTKSKHGWITMRTNKWKCDGCGAYLKTKTSYEYFKGICYLCRQHVPTYIPEEQIRKWLKQNFEKLKSVNHVE